MSEGVKVSEGVKISRGAEESNWRNMDMPLLTRMARSIGPMLNLLNAEMKSSLAAKGRGTQIEVVRG